MTEIHHSPDHRAESRSTAGALPAWMLLGAGLLLTLLTGPRWGIGILAWLTPAPYLLFARQALSRRAWGALALTLLVGHCAQCVIFATPPVPAIAVIGFGPPLAMLRFGPIALAEWTRRRVGEGGGVLMFVVGTVVFDWLGYGAPELGAWMATANSQVELLPLLQLASLGGMAGIGALMAWTSSTIALGIGSGYTRARMHHAFALAVVLVSALLWGTLRVDAPLPGASVPVATVVTDIGASETGMPDDVTLAKNTERLFAQTRVAAARGARLIVWNEVATLVYPDHEGAFVERARRLATDLRVDLVLAYAVLETRTPPLLDNKYVFITDHGEILDTYRKHHPVPGEPSIRGEGPLQVVARPYGKVGGAICYDYDFPALAREHARAGAELVVVPASDWRGIDPVHTFMARVRAIEGGFTVVRAARWGASGAFDAHGQVRAWQRADDSNDGIMLAQVPVGRSPTLATKLADTPVALAAVIGMALVVGAWRRRVQGSSLPTVAELRPSLTPPTQDLDWGR